jgi:hypothetical protein
MSLSQCLGVAGAFVIMLGPGPVFAEGLGAADLAWIDKCVADRKLEQLDPVAALRSYCACIQEIVEDIEPFLRPNWSTLILPRM